MTLPSASIVTSSTSGVLSSTTIARNRSSRPGTPGLPHSRRSRSILRSHRPPAPAPRSEFRVPSVTGKVLLGPRNSELGTYTLDPPLRRLDLVHRRHRLRAGPEASQEVTPAPGDDGVD